MAMLEAGVLLAEDPELRSLVHPLPSSGLISQSHDTEQTFCNEAWVGRDAGAGPFRWLRAEDHA